MEDKDRSDRDKLESKLMKFCKDLKGKEERFVSTCENLHKLSHLKAGNHIRTQNNDCPPSGYAKGVSLNASFGIIG